jgi:long-chain acyl-CoA synthetase
MQETKVTILLGVPQLYAGLRRAVFDGIGKKPAAVRIMVRALLTVNGLLRNILGVNAGKALFGKVHAMFGPSLRLFASGGARLDPDVYTDMTRLGFTVIEGYGLTETSPAATYNHEHEYRPGSVGTPVDMVEMRVVDEEDRDVRPGAWGEVVFRGPNVMLGYWNRAEETRVAMRGGWFHTGDVGYTDEDGYLYLVDRVKDMVNTAGFKIWPREVEEVLYRHPAVGECAVVGMPDAVKGEIARAFVVRRPGAQPTGDELDAYCRRHLAGYKVPRAWEFVDELPKSATGKILKRILRERSSEEAS